MKIALLESFLGGSHQQWSEGLQMHTSHAIRIFSLPGRHWKWRMYGGAVSLAQQFLASEFKPDLILASDMLDLTTFLSLCKKRISNIPIALYFHENQITYPWSPDDADVKLQRNNQYGFINYTSALAADVVFFNSQFHQNSFIQSLPAFLRQFPDHREYHLVADIQKKSQVLPLGMNLKSLSLKTTVKKPEHPVFLWNHRWEYDKNPEDFFQALFQLKTEGLPFHLIVLGQSYQQAPQIFAHAKEKLSQEILHYGFVASRKEYAQLLHLADILPVTSRQDFFGISTVEAIYCNCHPILPRRLAFPEHVPEHLHDVHFYDTTGEFFKKIKTTYQQIEKIRHAQNYQNFVAHYDWSILAPQYDQRFVALLD